MKMLILGACFAWLMTALYYEHKQREKRNGEEWWYDRRNLLKSIAYEFECQCWEETEKALERHNKIVCRYSPYSITAYEREFLSRVISNYGNTLNELKQKYISELNEKYVAKVGKYRAGTLPEDLISEYKRNISDISDTFYRIKQLMWEQLDELNERS